MHRAPQKSAKHCSNKIKLSLNSSKVQPWPLRLDGLPGLTTVGSTAGSFESPLRMQSLSRPRPHQTSSGQLSGSRCCLSREGSPSASPTASPTARVGCIFTQGMCAHCLCVPLLKAKLDKFDWTPEEDHVTSTWGGDRTRQTIRLTKMTAQWWRTWYGKRQKNSPRDLIDGLFVVHVNWH